MLGRAGRSNLHAADLLLVKVFVETRVKVSPPLKQHGVANKLKPGSELELGVLELGLERLGSDVLGGLDLVRVDVEIDVRLDEEDVIDCTRSWLEYVWF